MPSIDYAKRITKLGMTHIGWRIEIDGMPTTHFSLLLSYIDTMNAYYKIHAYHRVFATTSSYLPDDWVTDYNDHIYYWNNYFGQKGIATWEYLILVRQLAGDYVGWHYEARWFGIRIADWGIALSDYYISYQYAIMHEYGHHIFIVDLTGYPPREDYCDNPSCVMAEGCPSGWYCLHHWMERQTL